MYHGIVLQSRRYKKRSQAIPGSDYTGQRLIARRLVEIVRVDLFPCYHSKRYRKDQEAKARLLISGAGRIHPWILRTVIP